MARPDSKCRRCGAWIATEYGRDDPAVHQGHAGTKADPRAPGDRDDICDVCDYAGPSPVPRASFGGRRGSVSNSIITRRNGGVRHQFLDDIGGCSANYR